MGLPTEYFTTKRYDHFATGQAKNCVLCSTEVGVELITNWNLIMVEQVVDYPKVAQAVAQVR